VKIPEFHLNTVYKTLLVLVASIIMYCSIYFFTSGELITYILVVHLEHKKSEIIIDILK